MKTANFKEWSLTKLDKTFNLTQILSDECPVLQSWQAPLIWAGKASMPLN